MQLCHQPRVSPASFRWGVDRTSATWLPCAKRSFLHVWDLRVESTLVVGRSPSMFCLICPSLPHSPPSIPCVFFQAFHRDKGNSWTGSKVGHAGGWLLVLAFLGCPLSFPFPTSLLCPYALIQFTGLCPCSSSRLRHSTKPFSLSTHWGRGRMWSQIVTILGGPCFM